MQTNKSECRLKYKTFIKSELITLYRLNIRPSLYWKIPFWTASISVLTQKTTKVAIDFSAVTYRTKNMWHT